MPRFLQKIIAGTLQVTGGTIASGRLLTSDEYGNATWQPPEATQSINTQSGTTYTLVLADADANKLVLFTSNSETTVTVPANASVAFPVGARVKCLYNGSATLSVSGASGVTISGRLIFDGGSFGGGFFGPYAMSTSTMFELIKTGTNAWAVLSPQLSATRLG
jgi:hypothetical protein